MINSPSHSYNCEENRREAWLWSLSCAKSEMFSSNTKQVPISYSRVVFTLYRVGYQLTAALEFCSVKQMILTFCCWSGQGSDDLRSFQHHPTEHFGQAVYWLIPSESPRSSYVSEYSATALNVCEFLLPGALNSTHPLILLAGMYNSNKQRSCPLQALIS